MTTLAMLPWFPRDFIASTRAMRLAERGAYRDLLDYQWEMGCLPSDHERLARLLGCSAQEFSEVWPAIKDKFVLVDGYLVNQRLEEHRKKAIEQRDKKVRGAEKTNAKRYGQRHESESVSDTGSETLSGSPPSPSPSPSPNSVSDRETAITEARQTMSAAVEISLALRSHGVMVSPSHPEVVAWVQDGFTVPQIETAFARARESKPEGKIASRYLDTILRSPQPAKRANGSAKQETAFERISRKAKEAGADNVTEF